MAPKTNKTAAASDLDPTAAFSKPADRTLDARFTKVSTERKFFKPGETDADLQGVAISVGKGHAKAYEQAGVEGSGDYEAATIRLTAPTKIMDDNVEVELGVGDDVLLVLTAGLRKVAGLAARGKIAGGGVSANERLPEINVRHLGKRKIPGGKTKNEYELQVADVSDVTKWVTRGEFAPDTIVEEEPDATDFDPAKLNGTAPKALPATAS